MNLKADEQEEKPKRRGLGRIDDPVKSFRETDLSNEFEKMVQKLESDVRSHIRTEQQLKLHIETLN